MCLSLCAGLAPELRLLLEQGFHIRAAFAVDTDRSLLPVWETMLAGLRRDFAGQLAPDWDRAFEYQFPADVADFMADMLCPLDKLLGASGQLVICAGWECRSRSRAGLGLGVLDPRAPVFDAVVSILHAAHARWPGRVVHLLENVPVSLTDARGAVRADELRVREALGPPSVVFCASEVGSAGVRRRAWWSNLPLPSQIPRLCDSPPLEALLEPGRRPCPGVTHAPTAVSATHSWARTRGLLPVLDASGGPCSLLPAELERVLGHPAGLTASGSPSRRQHWLGQSWDCCAARALLAASLLVASPPGGGVRPIPRRPTADLHADGLVAGSATEEPCGASRRSARGPSPRATAPASAAPAAVRVVGEGVPEECSDDGQDGPDGPGGRVDPPASEWARLCLVIGEQADRSSTATWEARSGGHSPAFDPTVVLTGSVWEVTFPDGQVLGYGVNDDDHPAMAMMEKELGDVLDFPLQASGPVTREEIEAAISPDLKDHPQREEAIRRLMEWAKKGAIATSTDTLGKYAGPPLRVNLVEGADTRACKQKRRQLSKAQEEAMLEELEVLERIGVVGPSNSPFAANPVVVKKKDGKLRFCVDFRNLNAITVPNAYPLPGIDPFFDAFARRRANVFSKTDMNRGFQQLPIHPEDWYKLAFYTPKGLYEYRFLAFGPRNGPPAFQEVMDELCAATPASLPYIDDVITGTCCEGLEFEPPGPITLDADGIRVLQPMVPKNPSFDLTPAMDDVDRFFAASVERQLTVKLSKCLFYCFRVEALGFYLSSWGREPATDKLQAIRRLSAPTSVKGLLSFLGMIGFYRAFMASFSAVAAPLRELQQKGVAWRWGDDQEAAFAELKRLLMTAPILRAPDYSKRFIVETDWSCLGYGAVLHQEGEGGAVYAVAFFSRSCTKAESKYSSFMGELLCLVTALKHWRWYLLGTPFDVRTDHAALLWLLSSPDLPPMATRWALQISDFDFSVRHKPGKDNVVPDYLSRSFPALSGPQPVWPRGEVMAVVVPMLLSVAAAGDRTWARARLLEFEALRLMLAVVYGRLALRRIAGLDGGWAPASAGAPPAPISGSVGGGVAAVWAVTGVAIDEDVADGAEAAPSAQGGGGGDVWDDAQVMAFLRTGPAALEGLSPQERDRVRQRGSRFRWENGPQGRRQLIYQPAGNRLGRVCPPPEARAAVLAEVHSGRSGVAHMGTARMLDVLTSTWYWRGMAVDVEGFVRNCPACSAARAVPAAKHRVLQPLPICPLFHRLHVDLAGPLRRTRRGNVYIWVGVESLSRAVFLFAIPNKEAETTVLPLRQLSATFGYIAQVVSDQGREWEGAFKEYCVRSFIQHRHTSAHRPQANGRAERDVQTVKNCLRRILQAEGGEWDDHLEQLQLAYNCSKHAATGFAPYTVLYASTVLMPVQARGRFREVLDVAEDSEELGRMLRERAAIISHVRPVAMENWEAANLRNSLRYGQLNSGSYTPTLRADYRVGDLVYIRRRLAGATTLDLGVDPDVILQIVHIRPSGVLRLQGRDGGCLSLPKEETAPCHRVDVVPAIDPTQRRVPLDLVCELCEATDVQGKKMMLCTMCSTGWHLGCLQKAGMFRRSRLPPAHLAYFCRYCHELRELPCPVDVDGVQTTSSYSQGAVFLFGGPSVWATPSMEPLVLAEESEWQLSRGVDAVGARLARAMPGLWVPAHVHRLWRLVPRGVQDAPARLLFVPTAVADYEPLRTALRWSLVGRVLDPWAGEGATRQALGAETEVCLTDLELRAPLHAVANALELSDLGRVAARLGPFQGVVASPWFALLDLALTAALELPVAFVAFHVPGHYLADATPPRAAFLQRLQVEGRLLVRFNLGRAVYGGRCAWLVVFRSREDRARLQRDGSQTVGFAGLLAPLGGPSRPRPQRHVAWAPGVVEHTHDGRRAWRAYLAGPSARLDFLLR